MTTETSRCTLAISKWLLHDRGDKDAADEVGGPRCISMIHSETIKLLLQHGATAIKEDKVDEEGKLIVPGGIQRLKWHAL
jgi:hypothetical protein